MGWERNENGKWECNAVFKGGGAKGIAYVGALEECERWDIEFKEVAGASAGAITATLVACGYTAADTKKMMPEALQAIGSVSRAPLMLGRTGLLDNQRLYDFLKKKIWKALFPKDKGEVRDCTFAEIEREKGVSLYVVTLDLATRQPLVFCPKLTPDSPVAAAVVASSAIPVAFPAARFMVNDSVHRVVDGGTWSNYPSFVMLDTDFRSSTGLDPTTRPTIGFILDEEKSGNADEDDEPVGAGHGSPSPHRGRFLLGDRGSSAHAMGVSGGLLSSTLFRWSVGLVPILFVLLSAFWLRQELTGRSDTINRLPVGAQDVFIAFSVGLLALMGLTAVTVAIVILRLGKTMLDSGVVAASAAMGVGPSVPYWVGRGDDDDDSAVEHLAVRIEVPADLGTLTFSASTDLQGRARARGRAATELALSKRAESSKILTVPIAVDDSAEKSDGARADDKRKRTGRQRLIAALTWVPRQLVRLGQHWYVRIVYLLIGLVAFVAAAVRVVEEFAGNRLGTTVFWMAAVGLVMIGLILLVASARHREAAVEKPYRLFGLVPELLLKPIGVIAMAMALGTLFAVGSELKTSSFYSATRADEIAGVVIEVADRADSDPDVEPGMLYGVVVQLDEEELNDDQLDTFFDLLFSTNPDDPTLTDEGERWRDLVDAEVAVAGIDDDDTFTSSIFVGLPSLNRYDIGANLNMRVDFGRRVVFLEEDLKTDLDPVPDLRAQLIVGLAFGALSFRAWRAANWFGDQTTPRVGQ